MRRRTHLPQTTGQIPAELYDYRATAWASDATAQQWCRRHRLPADAITETTDARVHRDRQYRRARALRAWAQAHGYISSTYPPMLDCHRLGALGVVAAGSPTGPSNEEG